MYPTTQNQTSLDRAICAVFAASLGLVALTGRNTLLRALAAVTGAGLFLRATIAEPSATTASARSADLDDTLADSFPASDPPASRSPDVPPANAQSKWETHRQAAHADATSAEAAGLNENSASGSERRFTPG